MAVQTGRTLQDFIVLKLGSAVSDMQNMKIDSLGDLGLDYEEQEMSAWCDAVKGYIVGQPDFELEFGGPIDNTATTGPSTLLRSWVGTNTLLSLDVQIGVRHAWEAGEQQFGVTGVVASNSGMILTSYKESAGRYTARVRPTAGTAVVPAFGTAAETKPA